MFKRYCLFSIATVLAFTSIAQRKHKSATIKPLVFADSATISKRADSIKIAAILADTLTSTAAEKGLKSLLQKVGLNASEKLAVPNGFFNNPPIKIGVPSDDQKLERGLRSLGYGKQVDIAIESINHTAEDASKGIAPILNDAINNTSLNNALQVLKQSDTAGTAYLRNTITTSLISSVRPLVVASMEKEGTAQKWSAAFNTVSRFGLNKSNTDLAGYISERTVAGLFTQMENEEIKLRSAPETKALDLFQKLNKH